MFTNSHKRLTTGILSIFLFLSVSESFSQTVLKDFQGMKGTFFTHKIRGDADSLSSLEITELRDNKGVPVWFSRDFFKMVCLTGECRMIRIKIYWTGAATYLGIQISENNPLTKNDHTKFSLDDYKKLDLVLSDSLSILKGLAMDDLTFKTKKDNRDNEVDGYTSATPLVLSYYVVKDAVYTCYTLWHTVYGNTLKEIRAALDQRVNNKYLSLIFEKKDPGYICWGIGFIKRNPLYHDAFYRKILEQVKSPDIAVSTKAIQYFTHGNLLDARIQAELVSLVGEVSSQNKFEIFRSFSTVSKTSNEAILVMLKQYENKRISVGFLKYVCNLIRTANLKDKRIINKLKNLLKDESLYVRNLIEKLLQHNLKKTE